jgi:hypothetical protein
VVPQEFSSVPCYPSPAIHIFITVTHFRHRGTAVALALAKSACQVSRLLTTQTQACTHDPTEAVFIDETVTRLLLEEKSDDYV